MILALVVLMQKISFAHHNQEKVQLTLWNNQVFNIEVNGQIFHQVFSFNGWINPNQNYVRIWTNQRVHQGGRVSILFEGMLNIPRAGRNLGIITPDGWIKWQRINRRPGERICQRDVFHDLILSLDACYTDSDRYFFAAQFASNYRLSALQFEKILLCFNRDYTRYRFIQEYSSVCYEPQRFYRCYRTINNSRLRYRARNYACR